MTPLVRLPDWPRRLAEFVAERRGRPFAWGEHDCCLLAADWVLAATGTDLAAAWRGRYRTALEAARLARETGVASAGDPIGVQNWPAEAGLGSEYPRCWLRRGDLALVRARPEHSILALGVCLGTDVISPGLEGAVFTATMDALAGWRIG